MEKKIQKKKPISSPEITYTCGTFGTKLEREKNSTRINLRNSEKVEKADSMKKNRGNVEKAIFFWFHRLSLILLHHNFTPLCSQISHLQLNKRANESSK